MESEDEDDRLVSFWKSLNPPKKEEELVQKWYGCIYRSKKKDHLYVGKAVRHFLSDNNGVVTGLEVECLKPHVGTDNILESVPDHLGHDVDIFEVHNIIDGPLDVIHLKSGKWEIPSYQNLKERFARCIKIDRKTLLAVEL